MPDTGNAIKPARPRFVRGAEPLGTCDTVVPMWFDLAQHHSRPSKLANIVHVAARRLVPTSDGEVGAAAVVDRKIAHVACGAASIVFFPAITSIWHRIRIALDAFRPWH